MQTRSQQYSKEAFNHINSLVFVIDENDEEKRKNIIEKQKKQYGSLCHNFPIMVLRSGLSQAVAYVWVKSKGDENSPQGLFLKHLSEITSGAVGEAPDDFQQRINRGNLTEYQRLTRQVLAASIWYKRFAESLLGVTGDNNDS